MQTTDWSAACMKYLSYALTHSHDLNEQTIMAAARGFPGHDQGKWQREKAAVERKHSCLWQIGGLRHSSLRWCRYDDQLHLHDPIL